MNVVHIVTNRQTITDREASYTKINNLRVSYLEIPEPIVKILELNGLTGIIASY